MKAANGGFHIDSVIPARDFLLRIRLSASTDIEKNMAK